MPFIISRRNIKDDRKHIIVPIMSESFPLKCSENYAREKKFRYLWGGGGAIYAKIYKLHLPAKSFYPLAALNNKLL